jgi:hypothetical protein
MTHPIHNLPPEQLRGYARGLRETADLLHAAWNPVSDGAERECNVLVDAIHASWLREAELVEGFAARLKEATPKLAGDAPNAPFSTHGMTLYRGLLRRADAHTSPTAAAPMQVCFAADIQCPPGCTASAGGTCARQEQPTAETGAPDLADEAQPSRGEGDHAGATAPLAAAPTEEESAQTGLADAVAESLAEPQASTTIQPPLAGMAEDILKARREKAKAAFLTGEKPKDIARQLGIPEGSINSWASKYGWRKDLAVIQANQQHQLTRTLPTPLAEPIKPSPTMLPEDMAEAREKLRTGEFKGAKAIMEEYGCTQDEAQALVDAHRAALAARRAA